MNAFRKTVSKIGVTAMMVAAVVSASALYANAGDRSYTLSARKVNKSFTSFGSHCYNATNMNGIEVIPVCMYSGLKVARAKVYDKNQGIYLRWNGTNSEISAPLTLNNHDWVCDMYDIGDHTFTFYVRGETSGKFSGKATVV